MFRRPGQSSAGFPHCKFGGRDCRLRSVTLRFQRRNRDSQEWCRVTLSASSFLFSRRHALFQRRHRLSFVVVELHDTEKVLRCVVQSQSRGEIVADEQKDQRREHHHSPLGGVACLWRHRHQPDLTRRHAKRNDVDRNRIPRQWKSRDCVRLREIVDPEKVRVSKSPKKIGI